MNVDDLIEKTKSHIKDYQYWLDLEKDINKFMNSCASEDDKKRLKYQGQTEKVYMICRGYEQEKRI